MRVYTRARRLGELPLGVFFMLPVLLLPLGAWLVESGSLVLRGCGMKKALGMPCLSCGSTRATLNLLHGNVLEALLFQPMMIGIYALFAIWGMVSLASFVVGRRLVIELDDREDLAFKIVVVTVPFLNWIYLVAMGI